MALWLEFWEQHLLFLPAIRARKTVEGGFLARTFLIFIEKFRRGSRRRGGGCQESKCLSGLLWRCSLGREEGGGRGRPGGGCAEGGG